jgi:peptidoglycan/LPS O-acetylase OafA/YrhL
MNKTDVIIPLTSIRGFAALFVVWYHVSMSFSKEDFWFFHLFVNGDLSVDLFFVLSGFILHHAYKGKSVYGSYKLFLFSRLARIYPLHIITLFTVLILVLISDQVTDHYQVIFTKSSFLMNLLLVQNWGMIPPSWNMVSWSISAEWFMYLLFPIMIFYSILFKLNQKPLLYFLFSIALLVIYYFFIYFFKLEGYGGLSLGGMVRVFFEFTIGFCLYGLRAEVLNYRIITESSFLTSFLCVMVIFTLSISELYYFFLPISAMLLLNLSVADNKAADLFKNKTSVWLGEISYSLYMWHWIIIQIFNYIIYRKNLDITSHFNLFIYFCIVTIVSLFVAHYSHKFIELKGKVVFKKYIMRAVV